MKSDDDDVELSLTVPENCKQLKVSIGVPWSPGVESDILSVPPMGVDVFTCLVRTFLNSVRAGSGRCSVDGESSVSLGVEWSFGSCILKQQTTN